MWVSEYQHSIKESHPNLSVCSNETQNIFIFCVAVPTTLLQLRFKKENVSQIYSENYWQDSGSQLVYLNELSIIPSFEGKLLLQ